MTRLLGFDDLSVGQRFTSRAYPLTQEEILHYAGEFDPQPFHTDPEAAKSTFFGGLAASGWHTAALTMKLVVECVPLKGGVIGGGGELLWPKATRPGDTLTVECEILGITPSRSRPDKARVDMRILTRNQAGDVVQSFTPKLVVLR